MKTSEIDDLIREALDSSDLDLWDELSEQSLPQLVTETFLGRHRLLTLYSMVVAVVMMALGVYCVVRMFDAPDDRSLLLWFAGASGCCLAVFGIKVWSWLELTRVALTREVKRVELQIAQLAKRVDGS